MATGVDGDESYPTVTLNNGEIEVTVYLPDAKVGYYRGTRFDWSGIIERVDYRGHRFYAPLYEQHDPTLHDSLGGPADEFAMFEPMGFAEAEAGETFVKIGVGLLAKGDSDEYRFHERYRLVRPGDWEIQRGDTWITFTQSLTGGRGWAYRYRKTIRLVPGVAGFEIEYQLENRGAKTIDIDHYNHNFTLIDDTAYGPDYSVELGLSTSEPVSINDLAWFRGNVIEADRPLGDNALWAELYRGEPRTDYNTATIRNKRTGAAVSFTGSAGVERMVFWAVERAACPEPFIHLHLAPGETQTWSSRYRFSVEDD